MISMADMAPASPDMGGAVQRHGDMAVTCKACRHRFSTLVRGNTVRCPACKAGNWIPKTGPAAAEVVPLRPAAPLAVWAPEPVPAAEPDDGDGDCPDCGTPLVWTPGGTLHYCETCEAPVFPAVLLPEAGEADPRRVPTQAERDLAAIALAQRKGVMLVVKFNGVATHFRIGRHDGRWIITDVYVHAPEVTASVFQQTDVSRILAMLNSSDLLYQRRRMSPWTT